MRTNIITKVSYTCALSLFIAICVSSCTKLDEYNPTGLSVENVWDFAWGPIKDCNKSIELSTKLVDGNANHIKILVAEARLLRAYYYSVVVAQFGSVPLILTDDPTKNLNPKRASVSKIYAQ